MTRSGRLLLSILGAFAIATAGVAGAAAAPLEPSANQPAAQAVAPGAAAAPLEPSANLPAAQAAAPDAAPAAGQVTTTQEPADCAPTTSAGKPCDPVGPTSGTVSPNLAWSVTLAASATMVLPGANVTLTATANQDVGPTFFYIYILDGVGTVVNYCGIGTTCAATVSSATTTTRSYTAVIDTDPRGSLQATSGTVTVVWMPTISGTVKNASSVGLSGILVWACLAGTADACEKTTSTVGGAYTVGVPPNTTYDIWFQDQSGTYWYNYLYSVQVVTTSLTGQNMTLQLIPPWTVTLAASANPVLPGTNVTLTATANQSPWNSPFSLDIVDGNGSVVKSCSVASCVTTVTSATATSRTYRAVIAHTDGSSQQATSNVVTVVWTTISGTVRNASAVPLAGISVMACASTCATTQTDANGAYSLAAPPNATYNMAFSDPSGTYFTWIDPSGVAVVTSPRTGIDATLSVIPPWTVTLAASATSVSAGANVTLTATANQDVGSTIYWIDILDGNGVVLNSCGGGTTCTATVTSATAASVSYRAVIAHINGSSEKATSSIVTVVWMTVPGAPTGVTATPGNKLANISWTAPAANGSAITGYTVTSSPGGRTCNPPGWMTSCAMTFLTNGTAYTFTVVATNGVGPGPASAPSNSVTPLGGATYFPLTPTRILDTRSGTGLLGPSGSHVARTFQVTGGTSGVPANAAAVTGNLTVTGQTSSGYLFLGPVAMNDPTSSTLNFPVGDDRANGVTVALGVGGTLSVTFVAPNPGPTAHAIFDVTGYFVPGASGATYLRLAPTRILDTRSGTGLSGPSGSHAARTFQMTGRAGIPLEATAVTGNLTVTGQTSNGYLFLGPNATNDPTSSTLNFPVGDDRANGVTVALGVGGTLSVTFVAPNPGPIAHVIFDVTGYFVPGGSGASYVPLNPSRILDSRNATGLTGPSTSHAGRAFAVGGVGGIPADTPAVTGNLTVTGQTSNGYLFLGPVPIDDPTSSTLNFPVGDDRANGVTVGLGPGGTLGVTFVAPAPGPTAHVIFDVTGYFLP